MDPIISIWSEVFDNAKKNFMLNDGVIQCRICGVRIGFNSSVHQFTYEHSLWNDRYLNIFQQLTLVTEQHRLMERIANAPSSVVDYINQHADWHYVCPDGFDRVWWGALCLDGGYRCRLCHKVMSSINNAVIHSDFHAIGFVFDLEKKNLAHCSVCDGHPSFQPSDCFRHHQLHVLTPVGFTLDHSNQYRCNICHSIIQFNFDAHSALHLQPIHLIDHHCSACNAVCPSDDDFKKHIFDKHDVV